MVRRLQTLEHELEAREDLTDAGFFGDLVVQDAASVQGVRDQIAPEDLAAVADILSQGETVYLLGRLRSAPVVKLLRSLLTMLGKKCILLDPGGGLATHTARMIGPGDVLIAVSFRFYAKEVVAIMEETESRGAKTVAIPDSTLSPLAKSAHVLFSVPECEGPVGRSLAAPITLAQALVAAVVAVVAAVTVVAQDQNNPTCPRSPSVTGARSDGS